MKGMLLGGDDHGKNQKFCNGTVLEKEIRR